LKVSEASSGGFEGLDAAVEAFGGAIAEAKMGWPKGIRRSLLGIFRQLQLTLLLFKSKTLK